MTTTPAQLTHLAKLLQLEAEILEHGEQIELRTEHFFAHGTYTRVLHIPAGVVVTGEIHRHSCVNIMPKGKLRLSCSEGERELTAPFIGVSGAGEKKAVYAIEDSIWVNVFPWTGQRDDIPAIVRELSVDPDEILDALEAPPCH